MLSLPTASLYRVSQIDCFVSVLMLFGIHVVRIWHTGLINTEILPRYTLSEHGKNLPALTDTDLKHPSLNTCVNAAY